MFLRVAAAPEQCGEFLGFRDLLSSVLSVQPPLCAGELALIELNVFLVAQVLLLDSSCSQTYSSSFYISHSKEGLIKFGEIVAG